MSNQQRRREQRPTAVDDLIWCARIAIEWSYGRDFTPEERAHVEAVVDAIVQERNEAQAALSRQEQTIRELNHDTRKAEDECDRLREALELIAGTDQMDAVLDPDRALRVARAALRPPDGEG
jgi:uncharacterized coiled-coil protein SlyX